MRLITSRSKVRFLPPQPNTKSPYKPNSYEGFSFWEILILLTVASFNVYLCVMDTIDYSEKRKYGRIAMQSRIIACAKKKDGSSAAKEFQALGKNIGAEGILFISSERLEPGTKLTMKIDFPGEEHPIPIEGEVKWCRHAEKHGEVPEFFDTGVKFLGINKNHLQMLIKYVCGNLAGDLLKDIDG